jgi:DNA-binding MarR family transcriptional regulator
MEQNPNNNLITSWLTLTQIQMKVAHELEMALQDNHQLSLNEFYLLLFLFEAPGKKLKLNQLENMVGLSQSAVSRLVSRFEGKGCGALQRQECQDDRRSVYTALTPIGEKKLVNALATFNTVLAQDFSGKEIRHLLQKLTD